MSKQEGAGSFIDPTLSCAKEDRYLDRYDPDRQMWEVMEWGHRHKSYRFQHYNLDKYVY